MWAGVGAYSRPSIFGKHAAARMLSMWAKDQKKDESGADEVLVESAQMEPSFLDF